MADPDEHEGLEGMLQRATPAADLGARQSLAALEAKLFGRSSTVKVGRYELHRRLASGGGGAVYEGRDPDDDRKVAIKLLHTGHEREGAMARDRLLREAQSLATLSHPNIIEVYAVGEYDPGTLGLQDIPSGGRGVFVAMEYVEGQTLEQWWTAAPRGASEILEVMRAAGDALATAHEHGIVHRDFKPANVMLRSRTSKAQTLAERVRVLDFGLAKMVSSKALIDPQEAVREAVGERARGLGARPMEVSLTATGALLGTPAYMAPEQHERKKVDARADQYSFCLTAYEGLVGHSPVPAGSMADVAEAKREGKLVEPRDPPALPSALKAALRKGLQPDPNDRFDSMRELLAELRLDARPKPRKWLAIAGLAVVAVIAGLVLWPAGGCEDEAQAMASAWDTKTRDEIDGRLRGLGTPWAAHTATTVSRQMQDWIGRYEAVAQQACATSAEPEKIVGCLQAARGDAVSLLARLQRADHAVGAEAIDDVATLPDPRDCDPDHARRPGSTAAIRATLAAAEHHLDDGEPLEAVRVLTPMAGRTNEVGSQSMLTPTVLATLAHAQREAGLQTVAQRTTERADAAIERVYGLEHPGGRELATLARLPSDQ